ncbi:MAG: N-acetyltransferase [Saprospiraceae bacterium]|nr:N-acetyltransferase [Saprospiraceae bacterium]
MKLYIRTETAADLPAVAAVVEQAFQQKDEAVLVDRLRRHPAYLPALSLVAEADGQVVGHLLFTPAEIQDGGKSVPTLCLAPMSVAPGFQKKGVGKELIRTGLQKARELGFRSVIVLGHSDYYPKFGFRRADRWNIRCPFPAPPEAFMALELVEGGLDGVAGEVVYLEPFYQL